MITRKPPALPTEQATTTFGEILTRDGPHAALRYLNGHGRYRFTAVYRREGDTMRNVHFYDRNDPQIERSSDLPVNATYCQFAMARREQFVTNDAMEDVRLEGHPARGQVRAYCGVPLIDPEGTVLGSLCSFDFEPIEGDGVDLELMLSIPLSIPLRNITQ
ncbi:MAG: GAF domain-containing protein [Betaproteobacteria bacterium]